MCAARKRARRAHTRAPTRARGSRGRRGSRAFFLASGTAWCSDPEMAKKKFEVVDGLGPKDSDRLRIAIRKVWSWSHARKLCIARATQKDGFAVCELCKKKAPRVYADHRLPVGEFGPGFIERMFVPSSALDALCKQCHDRKTRGEAKARAEAAFLKKIGL